MPRPRSPQEKKVLSYLRDGRNSYGENDKASRKNIPRSKRLAHQAYRNTVKQALRAGDVEARDLAAAEIQERPFLKEPDVPLARYVEGTWRRRGEKPTEPSSLREEAKQRLRRSRRPGATQQ